MQPGSRDRDSAASADVIDIITRRGSRHVPCGSSKSYRKLHPAGIESKRGNMETEITLTIKIVPGGFAVNDADGKLIAVSTTPAALARFVKAWAEGQKPS